LIHDGVILSSSPQASGFVDWQLMKRRTFIGFFAGATAAAAAPTALRAQQARALPLVGVRAAAFYPMARILPTTIGGPQAMSIAS
jgi:hypothetical protein